MPGAGRGSEQLCAQVQYAVDLVALLVEKRRLAVDRDYREKQEMAALLGECCSAACCVLQCNPCCRRAGGPGEAGPGARPRAVRPPGEGQEHQRPGQVPLQAPLPGAGAGPGGGQPPGRQPPQETSGQTGEGIFLRVERLR